MNVSIARNTNASNHFQFKQGDDFRTEFSADKPRDVPSPTPQVSNFRTRRLCRHRRHKTNKSIPTSKEGGRERERRQGAATGGRLFAPRPSYRATAERTNPKALGITMAMQAGGACLPALPAPSPAPCPTVASSVGRPPLLSGPIPCSIAGCITSWQSPRTRL